MRFAVGGIEKVILFYHPYFKFYSQKESIRLLKDKTIVIAVTGGIAIYKIADLCSKLTQKGANVWVLMSESATRFVQPLTFQSLVKNPVLTNTFQEPDPKVISHINIADKADLFLVAPATANTIGKLANGIADDLIGDHFSCDKSSCMGCTGYECEHVSPSRLYKKICNNWPNGDVTS